MRLGFINRWRARPPAAVEAAKRVPDGLRLYAVGDIHGCADLLEAMAGLVEADVASAAPDRPRPLAMVTVFLGDYLDRGPQSREVLERLIQSDWPTRIVPLLGNHESMCLGFLDDPAALAPWAAVGGMATLASYGVDPAPALRRTDEAAARALREAFAAALPAPHEQFLRRGLETSVQVGDYFFCHAGVRPGVPLGQQELQDLIFIREPFLSSTQDFGAVVVHGHTPTEEAQLRPNRIGIDTGAYATGRLTALVLEGSSRRLLTATRSRGASIG